LNKQKQQTEKAREDEKNERLSAARAKILGGEISALSIDTCIFQEKGYRLNEGVFQYLEQFKENSFRLVFSEVTMREVISHIAKNADEAKQKVRGSLRKAGFFWKLEADHNALVDQLLGDKEPKSVALELIKDFVNRGDAEIVEAKEFVDLSALLGRYFNLQEPFESASDKKSEFPDAIALLSLEAWATKQSTIVLLVTKDKGCKRFCDESASLVAVDDLTDALTLIQERDQHCISLCQALEASIAGGQYPNLIQQIEEAIAADFSIDWDPEADSAFYYDAEIQDVELISAQFSGPQGRPELKAVDYRDGKLVVQVEIDITVSASCNFSFSVRDGIDRDMVFIGSSELTTEAETAVDVLIGFSTLLNKPPQIDEIQLVAGYRTIDFGTVEPDYGDEENY
jgi:hypothetical protein